jgi:hypothetical protein
VLKITGSVAAPIRQLLLDAAIAMVINLIIKSNNAIACDKRFWANCWMKRQLWQFFTNFGFHVDLHFVDLGAYKVYLSY